MRLYSLASYTLAMIECSGSASRTACSSRGRHRFAEQRVGVLLLVGPGSALVGAARHRRSPARALLPRRRRWRSRTPTAPCAPRRRSCRVRSRRCRPRCRHSPDLFARSRGCRVPGSTALAMETPDVRGTACCPPPSASRNRPFIVAAWLRLTGSVVRGTTHSEPRSAAFRAFAGRCAPPTTRP